MVTVFKPLGGVYNDWLRSKFHVVLALFLSGALSLNTAFLSAVSFNLGLLTNGMLWIVLPCTCSTNSVLQSGQRGGFLGSTASAVLVENSPCTAHLTFAKKQRFNCSPKSSSLRTALRAMYQTVFTALGGRRRTRMFFRPCVWVFTPSVAGKFPVPQRALAFPAAQSDQAICAPHTVVFSRIMPGAHAAMHIPLTRQPELAAHVTLG